MSTTQSVRAVAAQEMQRPPIQLKDGRNKIRLQLRKMSFERELDKLPAELKSLVELLMQSRSRSNGATYEIVAIWNRLRQRKGYWTEFQPPFHSEAHFLSNYALQDGFTLARLTAMVELFDQATFVLLGEEVLMYMMSSIGRYQSNADQKKRDYATIFTRYCRDRDAFDKLAFYEVVRQYVAERYEKPLAAEKGVSHKEWLKQQTKRNSGKTLKFKVVDAAKGQSRAPILQHDFAWKQDECGYCNTKTEIITSFIRYTRKLEALVREKLGEDALPLKPENLKSLENLQ